MRLLKNLGMKPSSFNVFNLGASQSSWYLNNSVASCLLYSWNSSPCRTNLAVSRDGSWSIRNLERTWEKESECSRCFIIRQIQSQRNVTFFQRRVESGESDSSNCWISVSVYFSFIVIVTSNGRSSLLSKNVLYMSCWTPGIFVQKEGILRAIRLKRRFTSDKLSMLYPVSVSSCISCCTISSNNSSGKLSIPRVSPWLHKGKCPSSINEASPEGRKNIRSMESKQKMVGVENDGCLVDLGLSRLYIHFLCGKPPH